MAADQTDYDVFISYSRKDNQSIPDTYPLGWVAAIRDHIATDHRQFSTVPLRFFFDTDEIKDAEDWRHRILGALRRSKMLLVCLSPNYFASEYCRWEWEEYLRRQVHQLMGSESVATVYFVEVPGTDEQANAKWLAELWRANYTDLRPWFPEGAVALQQEEVRQRMARLGESLWERLQRARCAMAVPGNLRWQNPHFLGRGEELRLLHEQLGTGAVGVVTAVHGLGGQGKTELAVAYAHGFADCYPAGLWSLGSEGKTELLPLIGELAWERALGFTPNEAEKADPALLGRGVLEHLKAKAAAVGDTDPDRGAAALLLLDNVSKPELLSPAQLATLPGGLGSGWLRIVATTRLDLREQKSRLALLAVDALDEDTALALVRDHQSPRDAGRQIVPDLSQGQPQFSSDAEEEAARKIVRALGGFTLAVEQVALYLGLHPEVAPSAFLSSLTARGLPAADNIPAQDADVAAQMLTQNKQLGLILDTTLAQLDAPTRTVLQFAALLPPDTVPWPWLRELTLADHPEIGIPDSTGFGADPWQTIQRRLSGLRLLTPGDNPQIARMHRLVTAHLLKGHRSGPMPAQGTVLSSSPQSPDRSVGEPHPAASALDSHLGSRADHLYSSQNAPATWELDALLLAFPLRLAENSSHPLAIDALFLTDKIVSYRTLPAAATFLEGIHQRLVEHAASDPANAAWQRDLSLSLEKLGDLAVAQGDLPGALQRFTDGLAIRERLAASDPANAAWQRDLSMSLNKLGDLAVVQGDLPSALQRFTDGLAIREGLAASDPANAAWQRDLSVSHNKLGDLAVAQGDQPGALRRFTDGLAIAEHLAASDPANAAWQRDLSVSHNKLGDLAVVQGDLPGALQRFTDGLAIAERLAASDPANTAWQRDLSVSLNKIGDLAVAQGDLPGGLQRFTDGLAIRERLAASDPANAAWQRDLSVSHIKLGDLAVAQGDLPGALRRFTDGLAIAERLAASDPANAAWQRDLSLSLNKLGDLAVAQGDLSGALRRFTGGLAIRERLAASDPANAAWQRDLSVSHFKLGDLAVAQGDLSGALRRFTGGLAIRERLAASDPANAAWQRDLSVSHFKLYQCAQKSGDEARAVAELTACFSVLEGMKRRGMHLDPPMVQFHAQLATMLGGEGEGEGQDGK